MSLLQRVHNPVPLLLSDAKRTGVPLGAELLLHLHLLAPQLHHQGGRLLQDQQHEGGPRDIIIMFLWSLTLFPPSQGCVQSG